MIPNSWKIEHAPVSNDTPAISRKEKQEAAVRLRNSGKSYRMIGEMLGVGVATIHRWVTEEHAAVPNETPAVTADSADGKAYPATQTPQSELDERALRIKAHVTSGMTREQAAKTEGVSLRTAYKDLARVDERLAEIPDLGDVPTAVCPVWDTWKNPKGVS